MLQTEVVENATKVAISLMCDLDEYIGDLDASEEVRAEVMKETLVRFTVSMILSYAPEGTITPEENEKVKRAMDDEVRSWIKQMQEWPHQAED